MKYNYILSLLPSGDIDILKVDISYCCRFERVYHKSYNPSETIKDNLLDAFKEWEKYSNDEEN